LEKEQAISMVAILVEKKVEQMDSKLVGRWVEKLELQMVSKSVLAKEK
jgi:hypothetical protein